MVSRSFSDRDKQSPALDPELVREVLDVIELLAARRTTMIVVTHGGGNPFWMHGTFQAALCRCPQGQKNGGGLPEQALKFFEQIYRVEGQARDEKRDKSETQADCIRRFRQKHSIPVLNALKKWLDEIAPKVLPDSKLGDAVSYTLNQWHYLTRYIEDGRMPIDNNLLERDIRLFATGRKSWLFSDTVDGAKASAVVYSLMLTCRAGGVEPLAWLRHVLTELPQRAADADINDLLPFNFVKAATA